MTIVKGLPRKPAFCLCGMLLVLISFPIVATAEFPGRLAISADGNDHDRDDIGATPMSLAILAKAGVTEKLVHFEYNDHVWSSFSAAQEREMTDSALGAASRFGFNPNIFYSAISNPTATYDHLAAQINRSSSGDPLYILAMGPMESLCQGIRRSNPFKRQYVTVVSHSTWNDAHQHNGSCTWDGLSGTGVKTVHIADQNSRLATPNMADVEWLANHADPNLRWVWSRMQIGISWQVVADVSDAGEVWYWMTSGDQDGSFAKLKAFFANGVGVPPPPDPDPTGACTVTGTGSTSDEALGNARHNFEIACGVTYGSHPDHDCDPNTAQTSWTCSTQDVGSLPVDPLPPPPAGECSAYGTGATSSGALTNARRNFEITCGVTYGSSPNHDCDPENAAQTAWTCSTSKIY